MWKADYMLNNLYQNSEKISEVLHDKWNHRSGGAQSVTVVDDAQYKMAEIIKSVNELGREMIKLKQEREEIQGSLASMKKFDEELFDPGTLGNLNLTNKHTQHMIDTAKQLTKHAKKILSELEETMKKEQQVNEQLTNYMDRYKNLMRNVSQSL